MQLRITDYNSRLFSTEYCPPGRYWHSVSPPWPPAGETPRSGKRRAHELPEAQRRVEFMSRMQLGTVVTHKMRMRHGARLAPVNRVVDGSTGDGIHQNEAGGNIDLRELVLAPRRRIRGCIPGPSKGGSRALYPEKVGLS